MLNELGDAYVDLLEEHRRVLRDSFARHGGVEVDTQGDAFFVAFDGRGTRFRLLRTRRRLSARLGSVSVWACTRASRCSPRRGMWASTFTGRRESPPLVMAVRS